ncbi:MAG: hypothetical protein ACRDRJ_16915 [Streptosporangiaceae bacterium]
MTQEHLVGELSVLLEQLGALTPSGTAAEVTRLRHQVEAGPVTGLTAATATAIGIANRLCWDSLCSGDTAAFARQALVASRLRQFAVCGLLLADS